MKDLWGNPVAQLENISFRAISLLEEEMYESKASRAASTAAAGAPFTCFTGIKVQILKKMRQVSSQDTTRDHQEATKERRGRGRIEQQVLLRVSQVAARETLAGEEQVLSVAMLSPCPIQTHACTVSASNSSTPLPRI